MIPFPPGQHMVFASEINVIYHEYITIRYTISSCHNVSEFKDMTWQSYYGFYFVNCISRTFYRGCPPRFIHPCVQKQYIDILNNRKCIRSLIITCMEYSDPFRCNDLEHLNGNTGM